MRLVALVFAMAMLVTSTVAVAGPSADLDGSWALRANDDTLMTLELQQSSDGSWAGTLTGPSSFQLASGGTIFTEVRGPAKSKRLLQALVRSDHLELAFGATMAEATTIIWRLDDEEGGVLTLRDFPGPSLPFSRARPGEVVSSELDPERAYVAFRPSKPNAEMRAIFEADQLARQNPSAIDWTILSKEDEVRRNRTKTLLQSGKLRNGADFLWAAFIFQHGSSSSDFLLAHSLAQVAMARGRPDAAWISAASLDRYLHSMGQKQIYGTQFQTDPAGKTTQEPFDKQLISNELRQALGVQPAN